MIANTLEQAVFSNLNQLVTKAHAWVVARYDELCESVTAGLEPKPFEELVAMSGLDYTAPGPTEISATRRAV